MFENSEMGLLRFSSSWPFLLVWVSLNLCYKAHSDDTAIIVSFRKTPLPVTSSTSATFAFEVSEWKNGDCKNCSIKCKLDNHAYVSCEARVVLYMNLDNGEHKFEVCANGSRGACYAGYNWTVDTVPPTAYVTAATSFTSALNVSVSITFSEPCTGGGRFGCSSHNACNLLVYGAGQVIASTLKVLQPDLKFSLLVGLSASVQYGRVILVMDRSFCTDIAGNRFTRSRNSSYVLHFDVLGAFGRMAKRDGIPPPKAISTARGSRTDRRTVSVNLSTRIPEKLLELNSQTRAVEATNNANNLRVYLDFSEPVLNSSTEILSVLRTTNGFLLPTNGKRLGNRRFGFLVKNISRIAVVTITLKTSSLISRQGTPVSPSEPLTFLYDSQRPAVRLSTTSNMRTSQSTLPVLIKFFKPVFDFNASGISISGGHLQRFRELSKIIYTADVHVDDCIVSVNVPENITGDVAGNRNLGSNLLQVRHYSVPTISFVLYTITTAAFAVTSLAAGLLTVSTSSLQSFGALSRSSSYLASDPSRNLLRIACHIQIFALSKWLPVSMPVEYHEFTRGLQWSIPYLSLPWESGHVHSVMIDSGFLFNTREEISENHRGRNFQTSQPRDGKLEMGTSMFALPLSAIEYSSFFENQDIKPEAEFIRDSRSSDGWKQFNKNMFWLAVIGGSLMLLHALILLILKFRRPKSETEKCRTYGALVLPKFEIFLIILALPCLCQASAALIRGGSTIGIIVAILLLGVSCFLLLSLLLFLSAGITMGKLLQYKEIHREGQTSHWYQEIVRVTLGPGKRGQWTWKNQPNSTHLTMLGPLFEDLRGPPKYMLSQIAGGCSNNPIDRIMASDDETEDAEPPFVQKLFGILRIYYTLLESIKRLALGILAGAFSSSRSSSKIPTLVILSISSFQLFFLVLKKPFIRKKVQFVEILSVTSEVGIFAIFLVLLEKDFSAEDEKKLGIFMLVLFLIGFLTQMINEWIALFNHVSRLGPVENSFYSGFKTFSMGLLLILIPWRLVKNWGDSFLKDGDNVENNSNDRNRSTESRSRSESSGTPDKPWLKQLRELAKASFSREESSSATDPSSSQNRRYSFWGGKRSGSPSVSSSTDYKSRSKGLFRDLEAIFSSK